jgi:hypothetical protein
VCQVERVFRASSASQRIELLTALMYGCNPFELRFIATVIVPKHFGFS